MTESAAPRTNVYYYIFEMGQSPGYEPFTYLYPLYIRKELAHVPGGAYVTMVLFPTPEERDKFKESLANNNGYPGYPIWWGDVPPRMEWFNSKGFICQMWNNFA